MVGAACRLATACCSCCARSAVLFLIIEIVALVMGLALARSITSSVHELFMGTERVRQGDFTHRINIEHERSARRAGGVVQLDDRQHRGPAADGGGEEAARGRAAHRARRSRCRCCRAGRSTCPGSAITALCVPAREVGGDYYDFFQLPDDRARRADRRRSGKGTSAALYMAELKGLMLSLSQIYQSPRELLIEVNRIISENLDSRSFITMTYAVIDLRARRDDLRARRPHAADLPAAAGAGVAGAQVLTPNGMVLGLRIDGAAEMFERAARGGAHRRCAPATCIVLYTDGITEAMNADERSVRRRAAQPARRGARPPRLRRAARADPARDRGVRRRRRQHDDMTMILLKVERSRSSRGPR